MTFEPTPNTTLKLGNELVRFTSINGSNFVYAEDGKEGSVYKVLVNGKEYALKVFFHQYRNDRLVQSTQKLSELKDTLGLKASYRRVLTKENNPQLIKSIPELEYSLIMPWVIGDIWGNQIADGKNAFTQQEYYKVARSFCEVVNGMEAKGIAHCDLSNNNFLFDRYTKQVELIDLETIYMAGMERPKPDISFGTSGYRTNYIAQDGIWGPNADRFASAIILSEILTWADPEIRNNKYGDSSFFSENDIGTDSVRGKIMTQKLEAIDPRFAKLFRKAWFSNSLDECPKLSDWMAVFNSIDNPIQITSKREQTPKRGSEVPFTPQGMGSTQKNKIEEGKPEEKPQTTRDIKKVQKVVSDSEGSVPRRGIYTPKIYRTPKKNVENRETLTGNRSDQLHHGSLVSTNKEINSNNLGTPRLKVNVTNIDFGNVSVGRSTKQIMISNSGDGVLEGKVYCRNWIKLSQSKFKIAPGSNVIIHVELGYGFPRPHADNEYYLPMALWIEANVDHEPVIGCKFSV